MPPRSPNTSLPPRRQPHKFNDSSDQPAVLNTSKQPAILEDASPRGPAYALVGTLEHLSAILNVFIVSCYSGMPAFSTPMKNVGRKRSQKQITWSSSLSQGSG